MRHWIYLFFPMIFLAFESCVPIEGCMDEGALNYDITAEKDDGSCRYCEMDSTALGTLSNTIVDPFNTSPHYNENIISVKARKVRRTYTDSQCGINECVIVLELTNNLANEGIRISYG